MKIIKFVLVVLVVASVAACSSSGGGRTVDYKSAKQYSNLDVPPDLSSMPPSQRESGINTYSGYSAERLIKGPTSTSVLPTFGTVKLKRSGTQRWLVVNETPSSLWPRLREYVFGLGLSIERENKATGVIETNWAENRASSPSTGGFKLLTSWFRETGLRDRYRVRIEEGSKKRTSEIYLTHQGLEEVVSSGGGADIIQTRWQRRPSDPELEAELLRLLMIHLGVEDAKARSMLTAGIGGARASLVFDGKYVALMKLTDNFGSAWRRVGKALDNLNANIDKKDRVSGTYTFSRSDTAEGEKNPDFSPECLVLKRNKRNSIGCW